MNWKWKVSEWVCVYVERNLAGPVFAEEVANDAFAGLDDGEEVFLGGNLGIFGVAEGDPAGALLRHLLHLLEAMLAEGFDVVGIEAFQGGDLIVDLVLDGLRHVRTWFSITSWILPLSIFRYQIPLKWMNNESIRRRLSSSLVPSSPIVWIDSQGSKFCRTFHFKHK